MTFGNAVAAYKQQRKHDPEIKPSTVEYDNYRIQALLESWPELEKIDVSKITESDCKLWSEKNAKQVSSSSHNHTVGILRRVFKIAIEAGARYANPARAAKRVEEHTEKQIKLPELNQFENSSRKSAIQEAVFPNRLRSWCNFWPMVVSVKVKQPTSLGRTVTLSARK